MHEDKDGEGKDDKKKDEDDKKSDDEDKHVGKFLDHPLFFNDAAALPPSHFRSQHGAITLTFKPTMQTDRILIETSQSLHIVYSISNKFYVYIEMIVTLQSLTL